LFDASDEAASQADPRDDAILESVGVIPMLPERVVPDLGIALDASDGWKPFPEKPGDAATAAPAEAEPAGEAEGEHDSASEEAPDAHFAPIPDEIDSAEIDSDAAAMHRVVVESASPWSARIVRSLLLAAIVVAVCGAIGGSIAGAWWLVGGDAEHPEARYLPKECELFVSMGWAELAESDAADAVGAALGSRLIRRCEMFLRNAGLEPDDIERINAGRPRHSVDFLVVYRLNRPVPPEEVMNQPKFRGAEYERQVLRGVPVFVHPRVDSAVAFPEERVIVNGSASIVRDALRGRWGRGASTPLVGNLDFSRAAVVATAGVPEPLYEAHLGQREDLVRSVRRTVDGFETESMIRFSRTLELVTPQSADEIRQVLADSLAAKAEDPATPRPVRQMLSSVKLPPADGAVRIELTLKSDELAGPSRRALRNLF
jgi:hypothetical protein